MGRHKIKILDKKEQEGMRKVCKMGREVLDIAARAAQPGVTTDHIDKVVHEACIERDVSTRAAVWTRETSSTDISLSLTHHRSTTATSPNPSARA